MLSILSETENSARLATAAKEGNDVRFTAVSIDTSLNAPRTSDHSVLFVLVGGGKKLNKSKY